jgi:hypothetical protein
MIDVRFTFDGKALMVSKPAWGAKAIATHGGLHRILVRLRAGRGEVSSVRNAEHVFRSQLKVSCDVTVTPLTITHRVVSTWRMVIGSVLTPRRE